MACRRLDARGGPTFSGHPRPREDKWAWREAARSSVHSEQRLQVVPPSLLLPRAGGTLEGGPGEWSSRPSSSGHAAPTEEVWGLQGDQAGGQRAIQGAGEGLGWGQGQDLCPREESGWDRRPRSSRWAQEEVVQ